MPLTIDQFVHYLSDSGIMTADEVGVFQQSLPVAERPTNGKELAKQLVARKKLTRYQAEALYRGQTGSLVFGEYVLLEQIGAGGMGQVFKARHRRMDRVVALKLLPAATASTSVELVKRFQREIRAAARLDHPNIVTVHDAGESNGVMYLVMQYIEGRDFRMLVKEKKRLPVLQAAVYLLQVARGLEYMHSEGVIHRDVKPSNLLIDKRGMVKILDMGIARVEDSDDQADGHDAGRLTLPGEVIGSAEFMSPEQTLDSRHADVRSDIYSLGCTFYYLLMGGPPYPAETAAQKMIAHQEQPIPSLRTRRGDIPENLDQLFQKMLAKRPEGRQQSMSEVIAELEAFVVEEAKAARSPEQSAEYPVPSELMASVKLDATVGSTVLPNAQAMMGAATKNETILAHTMPKLGSSEINVPVVVSSPNVPDFDKPESASTDPGKMEETSTWRHKLPATQPVAGNRKTLLIAAAVVALVIIVVVAVMLSR